MVEKHVYFTVQTTVSRPFLGPKLRSHRSISGLSLGPRWVLLDPDLVPVEEPTNVDDTLRPPTEREGRINAKFKYSHHFERAPFTGTDAKLPQKPDAPQPKSARKDGRRSNNALTPVDKTKAKRIPSRASRVAFPQSTSSATT